MRRSRRLSVGVAGLVALATPGSACAETRVETAPVGVRAYRMQLVVGEYDDGGNTFVRGRVILVRRRAGSEQRHEYVFPRIRYERRGLRSAHLLWRGRGGDGVVDMTFRATRGFGALAPEDGCTRSAGFGRRGVLTGVMRLPVGDRYFGTIVRRRFRAVLGVDDGGSAGSCPDPPDGVTLETTASNGFGPDVGVESLAYGAGTRETVGVVTVGRGGVVALHSIDALGAASAFAPSPDGMSASVLGVGPFVTGRAIYRGAPDGADASSRGRLQGALRAHFDSLGRIAPRGSAAWRLALRPGGHHRPRLALLVDLLVRLGGGG